MSDVNINNLAETDNFTAWLSDEPDGEQVVHLELGALTRHFFREEWQEFVELVTAFRNRQGEGEDGLLAETENFAVVRAEDDPNLLDVELESMMLYFTAEDWDEVVELTEAARQAIKQFGRK